jgi:hypothetical protein
MFTYQLEATDVINWTTTTTNTRERITTDTAPDGEGNTYRITHLFMHPKWSENPIPNGFRVERIISRRGYTNDRYGTADENFTRWFLTWDEADAYAATHYTYGV